MPTNYVFVDFENVCEIDTTVLDNKNVILVLLVGAARTTLSLALVEKLLLHAASVQLVRLASRGKNALDFTLAYYLGCSATSDPSGSFHIISKDRGFDPLVEHLQSKHIRVRRHDDFANLTFSARPNPTTGHPGSYSPKPKTAANSEGGSATEDVLCGQVLARLRKTPNNRPKSRKRLISYVVTHLGNGVTVTRAENLIENLSQSGHVAIDSKGAVAYALEDK